VDSPEKASGLLRRFRRPVVSIGSEILEYSGEDICEQMEKICKTIDACIMSSSPSILERLDGGGLKIKPSSLLELADRLRDPAWMGIDGGGQHDVALFLGFNYYYSWLILSGLKNFAYKHLKTFSLDPYYQPNATYSLQNFVVKERWANFMSGLATSLEWRYKENMME
jgi:CO dehydrogenase/acetyl-CoA synthase complex epsilon subunit